MAAIQDRKAPREAAADEHRPAASGGRRRLWALLNAQALLDGSTAAPGGVLPAEDDRRRLSGRKAR